MGAVNDIVAKPIKLQLNLAQSVLIVQIAPIANFTL